MSRVNEFRDSNRRSLLRELRTDISMAVDDAFPLVYGLADKNIITEQMLKDTLEKQSREGIHKAMYLLLTHVLEQSRSSIQAFWTNMTKDYNLDSYPKLRTLLTHLDSRADTAGSRREKKSSGRDKTPHTKKRNHEGRDVSSKKLSQYHAAATDGPGGKMKLYRVKSEAPASQLPSGNSVQTVSSSSSSSSVQRAVALPSSVSSTELSINHTARESILIQQVFGSDGSARKCIKVDGEFYSEETSAAFKSKSTFHHKVETSTGTLHYNDDECAVCKDGGELICCDGCPRAFHLTCLQPPLASIPRGLWQCESCRGNGVKREETQLPLQCSVADVLSESELCGVCHLGGGDMTQCLECLEQFHVHCLFSKGRSICLSCSRSCGVSAEKEADCSDQLTPVVQSSVPHDPSSSIPESILHKDELDSILADGSIDGILQWAFHNLSRPFPEPQGFLAITDGLTAL